MKNIAIFASGEGTNAQNIIDYFKNHPSIKVRLVVSNKPDANVLKRAKNASVASYVTEKTSFNKTDELLRTLYSFHIDFIILAGFLWKIPAHLINGFPGKIINIHPSLLPKFGGKGMYGMHVHKAVVEAGEKYSGISIHFVNENYDEGQLISQYRCEISATDTAENVAQKIHQLEKKYFPSEIERVITSKND